LLFSSFLFLFSISSSASESVLKPFLFNYFNYYNLCLICFYFIIPCTSLSCSSAVLNLANTFIIL
jgi:hypothetical protein